jgi:hypothetical protein
VPGASHDKPRGREARTLPEEVSRQVLSFDELLATLDSLLGEEVAVPLARKSQLVSGAAMVGPLSRLVSPGDCARYGVGDSGFVVLRRTDVSGATLTTLEGSFYFIVQVSLQDGLELLVSDPEVGPGHFADDGAWELGEPPERPN